MKTLVYNIHGFDKPTLLGFDIEENKQLVTETNIVYTSFEDLCEKSDVISIHCPLNSVTKYLFNTILFSKMKRGAVLINTARAGIINTTDLMDAIEKPIFFNDHSTTKISDTLFLKLKSYPTVSITDIKPF